MKARWLFGVYLMLTAIGFLDFSGGIEGIRLLICGPGASLSFAIEQIEVLRQLELDYPAPEITGSLHRAIAVHGAIWLGSPLLVFLFTRMGWKLWPAVTICWLVSVPINLMVVALQNT